MARKSSTKKGANTSADPFVNLTVYVYRMDNGQAIQNATVHLEPRSGGLQYPPDGTTNQNGVAQITVADPGRYDIEVSHPDYHDDVHLRENVTGQTDSDTFYLEALP